MPGPAPDRAAFERQVLAPLLHRLALPEGLISLLTAHARSVEEATDRLGLVAPGDRGSIVARHTADSLLFALARAPAAGERWVDVGSGAGFPGLVLAGCYPATAFTLNEALARRAGFLELQQSTLGLTNVRIVGTRMSEGDFDVAVARALRSPEEALAQLLALVRPGGEVIVAVGGSAAPVPGVEVVRLGDLGFVDSPGLLFKMTRDGSGKGRHPRTTEAAPEAF